ncbi:MAG: GGDEF domain-containing protein, partial [Pseudohongiellaceae bacterium]
LVTGYEISFSIFYLLPVGLVAWYSSGLIVYFVCIVCAVTWGIVDYTSGNIFSNVAIPLWNTIVRAGFFLVVAILLTELKNTLATQEALAQLDGLTGIMNSRAFKKQSAGLCELSVRKNRPFAVGYIDLDNFKTINDSHGHSTGDQALKLTADVLTKRLRTSDICARLGGDEFGVILPETDMTGAQAVFLNLHEKLSEFATQNEWPIGFSVGVAVFHLNKGTPDEVIHCADELMYKVKHSGKNRILFEEYTVLG